MSNSFSIGWKIGRAIQHPDSRYPVIINKIKIRADLDISEKRLPQDGRITMKSNTDEFDIRVSSLPPYLEKNSFKNSE